MNRPLNPACLLTGMVHRGGVIYPETMAELAEAVREAQRPCMVVGACTKPALSAVEGALLVSTARMRGIVEYEPTEYTFTARSGTPLTEVQEALREHGQYLPFDPLLVEAGSTLGGAVAAGANGPGRIRFGGVRDFLVGVQWMDGEGRILRGGGKVVKNAAGFDFPKLFCGSMGRLGILTELTFKVFPQPLASLTSSLECRDLADALERLSFAARQSWEMEALEIFGSNELVVRMAGDAGALPLRMEQALKAMERPAQIMTNAAAAAFWRDQRESTWAPPDASLLRIPLTAKHIPAVDALLQGLLHHFSAAGNLAWVAGVTDFAALHAGLKSLGLSAVGWRGPVARLGAEGPLSMERMVKGALDAVGGFPSFPHFIS